MGTERVKAGLAVIGVAAVLAAGLPAPAQEKAPAAKGATVQVEEQDSIATVLKRLEGKPVKLRLAGNGEELSGKLAKVGKDVVHLSELSGREFFDAVVRVDQVAAVVVRTRDR